MVSALVKLSAEGTAPAKGHGQEGAWQRPQRIRRAPGDVHGDQLGWNTHGSVVFGKEFGFHPRNKELPIRHLAEANQKHQG